MRRGRDPVMLDAGPADGRRCDMDNERFASWVRALTTRRSRRGTLMGLGGGGLGLLTLAETNAKRHKKRKKKPGGSPPVVSCVGQPDLTNCGGGQQCSGGVCATQPNCGVAPDGCASPLECCGNVCDPAVR